MGNNEIIEELYHRINRQIGDYSLAVVNNINKTSGTHTLDFLMGEVHAIGTINKLIAEAVDSLKEKA